MLASFKRGGSNPPTTAIKKIKMQSTAKRRKPMNENATYQQLMLLTNEEQKQLSEPQKAFLSVHTEMVQAGQKAAECLLIMANDMRRMRDEKLYEAVGFETFKDYVEQALNIKERQAYNWISVLELPEAYLTKNAGMGVTKLALIASASEKVAEDLMADETTADKSVRELQAIIKQQEAELEDKTKQISFLTEQLEETPTAPEAVEVDTSAYDERIKELTEKLADANDKLGKTEDKLKAEKAKVKELKEREPEKVEVENPETAEKLEQARKDLTEAEAAVDKAKAEKAEAEEKAKNAEAELTAYKKTQEAVATFKVHAGNLFETFETVLTAVKNIKKVDPDLATKCLGKLVAFADNVKNSVEELQ